VLSGPVVVTVLVGFRVFYRKEDFLVLGVLNIFRKLKNNWVEFSKILDIKKKNGKKKKTSLVPCGSLGLYSLNQIQTRQKTKNQPALVWVIWVPKFVLNLHMVQPSSQGI